MNKNSDPFASPESKQGHDFKNTIRIALCVFSIVAGAVIGIIGLLLVSNAFGNTDTVGLGVIGCAGGLIGFGIAHFFLQAKHSVLVGCATAPLSVLLLFVMFWATVIIFSVAF